MNHISARRNSSTYRSWARLRVEGKERPKVQNCYCFCAAKERVANSSLQASKVNE